MAVNQDQLIKYEIYKNEIKQTEYEQAANKQLTEIGKNLVLTTLQKDSLFQAFVENQASYDPLQIMSEGKSLEEVMEQKNLEKQNRVKSILTDEQFTLYTLQKAQQEQLRGVLNIKN